MIGHLGPRVSALLDGQLSPEETERAWAHVHVCHFCRDQVEREGWVKTRLSRLSDGAGSVPAHLKGSLLGGLVGMPPGDAYLTMSGAGSHAGSQHGSHVGRIRRNTGIVAIGGGAVGAAVMGVLALGVAPADVPVDRRAPVTQLVRPSDTPRVVTPTLTPVAQPSRRERTP